MIGRGTYMRDALLTLKKAEKYGRAFSGDGSLTVVYARGKYTLS